MKIILGRKEVVATVFVPWDCMNHCSFCETKNEYVSKYPSCKLEENIQQVKQSIRKLGKSKYLSEYVFTGGEPLINTTALSELIDAVPYGKKIYVNTSFSFGKNDIAEKKLTDALDFLKNKDTRITSVSISCPMVKSFDYDIEKWANSSFGMPIRINSVVSGKETEDEIIAYMERISKSGFNKNKMYNCVVFRGDYRNTTQATLNSYNDSFFRTLMSCNDFSYAGSSGCLVCRSDFFKTNYGNVVYHRGEENTHIVFGDKLIINDFVIKQDGEIRFDWNEKCVMTDKMLGSIV